MAPVQEMSESGVTAVRSSKERRRLERHQGSTLNLLLVVMEMDGVTAEVRQEPPRTVIFADDAVICRDR